MQEHLTSLIVQTCLHELKAKIKAPDLDNAKKCFIDAIACAFTAYQEPAIEKIKKSFLQTPTPGGSSIIGYPLQARADDAALMNGAMISLQLFDDNQAQMRGHPSGPLLPAVLASAENCNATLGQALEAFVIGYELECRLGQLWNPTHYEHGWHATATQGSLAATLASALLHQASREQLSHAFGICASLIGGIRRNFGTMTMSLHSGLAASNGIKSTQLAMQGFTADPNIFDGPNNITQVMNGQCSNEHIQEHLSSWGQPFMISDPGCTFKLYPCGRPPLFAIDCVIALQEQHHFSIDDIQDIECEVSYMYPRTLIHSNPINGLQGKTSLEYCIAAAIVDARPKLESFTDQAIQRENIQKIMRCIRVIVPPHLSEQIESVRKAPFEQPVTLHVTTRNGKRLSHTVHHHKGSPENPASHADLLNKFKDAVAPWLEVHQSNEVMNLFNSTQTPVRSLMQALQIR